MKMIINNHRKIFALQQEFNEVFHNLKIEFYQKPSSPGGTSSKKLVDSSSKTLGDCRAIHTEGVISISPLMNIGELKQIFSNVYELTVDIFQRNAKNSWHELPVTERAILEVINHEHDDEKIK